MIDYKALNDLAVKKPGVLVPSKEGLFTILDGQQYVHSFYSPAKEAQRLVEKLLELDKQKTLIIILGAGLGYHIEILERAGFENIIVIEQNPVFYPLFKSVYHLRSTQFLIGPADGAEKLDQIFALMEISNVRFIKTIALRGAYKNELYQPFEDRIERLLKVKLGDFSTRLKFEELWFINTLKNLKNIRNSAFASQYMFQEERKFPILVISAGPSLKDSLKDIALAEPYCITIAVDTALLPLYEAGIVPDFVYSLDSQVHNLSDFSGIDPEYLSTIRLVYDVVVNPNLPSYFDHSRTKENQGIRNIVSNTAHLDFDFEGNPFLIKNELVNWLEAEGGFRIGDVETGGSVATSAFHFAYLLGGDPIILIGQDLAYSSNTSHSPSTSHFYRILSMTNRLRPAGSIFFSIMQAKKLIIRESVSGGEIKSDFVLNNFLGWFEESAKNILRYRKDFKLLNASLSGARIGNFQEKSLKETVKNLSMEGKPINKKNLHPAELIDSRKIDKMIGRLILLGKFINGLNPVPDMFDKIENSEWTFLARYFMKEKVLFNRNENFDRLEVERKIRRLVKTIEDISNG